MQAEQKSHGSIQYDSVLSAWRAQLAQAATNPDLRQRLSNCERELLPRFAAQYTRLQTLPRRVRRAMQRQWKRSLGGVALLLALGQTPAVAATINVSGTCTLVDAITAANTNTATGGCQKGSGADKLVLSGDVMLTAVNSDFAGPNGLPIVTSAITIEGNGATISRATSAPEFRIFTVDGTGSVAGNLTLNRTTISGGKLTAIGSRGGGILNLEGELTVIASTISGNAVPNASGDYESEGGGIAAISDTQRVTLAIVSSTLSNNSAAVGGGLRHGNSAP